MKTLLVLVLGVVVGSFAQADDKALLASPKPWKIVKSEDAPPGTTFTFALDGKFTMSVPIEGKPREMTGTYAVEGDRLTLKIVHEGRERVDIRTIKKLTETILVIEDKNKRLEELNR